LGRQRSASTKKILHNTIARKCDAGIILQRHYSSVLVHQRQTMSGVYYVNTLKNSFKDHYKKEPGVLDEMIVASS
jgi:hypothetical protein